MTQRTKQEIEQQVAGLQAMKQWLPERSMMGDKNWEKIDAQIAVITGEAEPDDYYQDETSDEYEDGDNDVWSDALRADEWLNGEEGDLFETQDR